MAADCCPPCGRDNRREAAVVPSVVGHKGLAAKSCWRGSSLLSCSCKCAAKLICRFSRNKQCTDAGIFTAQAQFVLQILTRNGLFGSNI